MQSKPAYLSAPNDKTYIYWAIATLGLLTILGISYWYYYFLDPKGGGINPYPKGGINEEISEYIRLAKQALAPP